MSCNFSVNYAFHFNYFARLFDPSEVSETRGKVSPRGRGNWRIRFSSAPLAFPYPNEVLEVSAGILESKEELIAFFIERAHSDSRAAVHSARTSNNRRIINSVPDSSGILITARIVHRIFSFPQSRRISQLPRARAKAAD